jgi:hypothetical protein
MASRPRFLLPLFLVFLVGSCRSGSKKEEQTKPARQAQTVMSDANGVVTVMAGTMRTKVLVIDADTQRPVEGAKADVLTQNGDYAIRISKDGESYQPELLSVPPGSTPTVALRSVTPDLRVRMTPATIEVQNDELIGEADLEGVAALSVSEKRPLVMFMPAIEEGASSAKAKAKFFVYRSPVPETLLAVQTEDGRPPGEGEVMRGKARVVSTAGPVRTGVKVRSAQVVSSSVAGKDEVRAAPQVLALAVSTPAGQGSSQMLQWNVEDSEKRLIGFDVGVDTTDPAKRVAAGARTHAVSVKKGAHFACVRAVFDGSDTDPQLSCVNFDAPPDAPAAPNLRVRVTPMAQTQAVARRAVPVQVEVENTGDVDAPAFDVAVVVSRDGKIQSGLGETRIIHVDGVKAHGKTTRSTPVKPSRDGSLYVVAEADGAGKTEDGNPEDNSGRFALTVMPPQGEAPS